MLLRKKPALIHRLILLHPCHALLNIAPIRNERIVRKGILRPAPPLRRLKQAIGECTRLLRALCGECRSNLCRALHTVLLQRVRKTLNDLPDHRGIILPLLCNLLAPQEAHRPPLRVEDALLPQAVGARILCPCEHIHVAELHLTERVLRIERDAKDRIPIECAVLLREILIQLLIDELERSAHRHRRTFRLEHLRIARVDRHAGTDGALRHIHGCDIALLETHKCGL